MNYIKLKLIVFCMFVCVIMSGQSKSMIDIMGRLTARTLPVNCDKNHMRDTGSSGVQDDTGFLSKRVYSNLQLTEWINTDEYPDMSWSSCFMSERPNNSDRLIMLSLADVGDFNTYVLLNVDKKGNITDQIDVSVLMFHPSGTIPVMQFRISEDGRIIVSRLVPYSTVSVSLYDITDFYGHREDSVYEINDDGKFHKVNVIQYEAKTYTLELLTDPDYNIWNGNEPQE